MGRYRHFGGTYCINLQVVGCAECCKPLAIRIVTSVNVKNSPRTFGHYTQNFIRKLSDYYKLKYPLIFVVCGEVCVINSSLNFLFPNRDGRLPPPRCVSS